MAGTTIEGQLTDRSSSAIRFALASAEDDSAVRRLLRNNPMPGEVSVSFEHEPNYFQSTGMAGADEQIILGFEQDCLVSMGRCSFHDRFLNSEIRRVGYLSGLRLDASAQGRFDILRRGYRFFHEVDRSNPADFYFTSVTSDNVRSLRFLERGLPGMPRYEFLTEFVTLLLPVPRNPRKLEQINDRSMARCKSCGVKIISGSNQYVRPMVEFLNSNGKQHNLAMAWDAEKLSSLAEHGLSPTDFKILTREGKIIGCAALWDQRGFKQTVIRGYSHRLSWLRPLLNWRASVFNFPVLPPVGSVLAHGFLSPLAVGPDEKESLLALVESSLLTAAERGLEFLTVGLAINDPRLAVVQNHFRCREYRNRFFQVKWNDEDFKWINLNGNLIFPEISLL